MSRHANKATSSAVQSYFHGKIAAVRSFLLTDTENILLINIAFIRLNVAFYDQLGKRFKMVTDAMYTLHLSGRAGRLFTLRLKCSDMPLGMGIR